VGRVGHGSTARNIPFENVVGIADLLNRPRGQVVVHELLLGVRGSAEIIAARALLRAGPNRISKPPTDEAGLARVGLETAVLGVQVADTDDPLDEIACGIVVYLQIARQPAIAHGGVAVELHVELLEGLAVEADLDDPLQVVAGGLDLQVAKDR
jgi:hypothetical protein